MCLNLESLLSSSTDPIRAGKRCSKKMSKVWAGVGAWALEAERAEAEERERAETAAAASVFSSGYPTLLAGEPSHSFPSLKEAASKSKKKKGVLFTLSEFTIGTYVRPGGARREPDETFCLPTGPRERTAEELDNTRLGGGFRSYGYGGGGAAAPDRRRPDFSMENESRRGPPRPSDLDMPSRADEVDNWASSKKFVPTMDSVRQERYGSLRSGGSSKADEVDNWSFGKKSTAPPPPKSYSGFGSGFRDFFMFGADSDRWVRGSRGSLSSNGVRERPRIVLDPPKRDSVSRPEPALTRPSPFGAAKPREDVLSERGVDWRKMETEIEMKSARPTSSKSSRPSSVHSSGTGSPISQVSGEGVAPKPRPKVNPFGDAKPREVILEEKGMDWRKINMELEHRGIERPEMDEEKFLKEEIYHLKKELAKETQRKVDCESALNSTVQTLCGLISQREKELYRLIFELDDKVRFCQRGNIDVRPGSGSGSIPFSSDRPPSESGASEDSRNMELMGRPRSRGRFDLWSKPMDEQRGFQWSRDLGFLSSGSKGRSKSRERW